MYLNENVSPAIGLLMLLSSTRTATLVVTVIQRGFLYDTVDAHSFLVVMLLVQWACVSIAPLVSVRLSKHMVMPFELISQFRPGY